MHGNHHPSHHPISAISRDTVWYTSGRYVMPRAIWAGDGTATNDTRDATYWIVPNYFQYNITGNKLVYTYSSMVTYLAFIGVDLKTFNIVCYIWGEND